ncbi:MAG TPA: 4-hydroxy-tetrahydrodipicolinate synthase [Phycisphaerales bacterium]|nr:4-hydroxy-tetrahydrodipicolinate synthase [Phycisphaerales bacterium]HMP36324.1 4-hydroxy-tetrahydrodipicolinate synthase [Phycisphaerales bacterium]
MFLPRGCHTAIVTPFTRDGSAVDFERLDEQVRFQAAGGVSGVVPCGTTGESPTLSESEQREVISRTIAVAKPLGLTVIAGAGSNSTAHAAHLHAFAAAAGADASLQVNPYYNKPSQEGLYRHFMTVAESADLPVVLYNIPGRTGVALAPATIERLASHPNIRAIKEATGSLDSASEIVSRCELALLSGDDTMTLPFASVGGVGVVSVVSNLLPAAVQELCDAFLADRWGQARALHRHLFAVCRGLLSLDTNPIPVKAAMELLGRDSGALRLPMCRGSEATFESVRPLLAAAGLLEPVTAGSAS